MKKLVTLLLIVVLCAGIICVPAGAAAAQNTTIVAVASKNNAPIRSGYYEWCSVVKSVKKGTEMRLLGSKKNVHDNEWYKVQVGNTTGNTTGWIYSGNVTLIKKTVIVEEPKVLQRAWFPAKTMNITQLAYGSYSHSNQNAIDLVSSDSLVAPFDGKVVYVSRRWGYVAFQSIEKVLFADGTVDYMTVCFMHDENIDDMVKAKEKGTVIKQGTPMYQQGGMGNGNPNMYGDHVHLSVWRGKYNSSYALGNGNVYAYNAFFVNRELTTRYINQGYNGRWRTVN